MFIQMLTQILAQVTAQISTKYSSAKHADTRSVSLSATGTHYGKRRSVQQLLRAKRNEVRWFKLVACIWCLVFLLLTANASVANEVNTVAENAKAENTKAERDTANTLANQLLNAAEPITASDQQIKAINGYKRELHPNDNTRAEALSENTKQQLMAADVLPAAAKNDAC